MTGWANQEHPTLEQIHRSAQHLETLLKDRNQAIQEYNAQVVKYRQQIQALNRSIADLAQQIENKARSNQDYRTLHQQLINMNVSMDNTNVTFNRYAKTQLKKIYALERNRQTQQKLQAIQTIVWSYQSVEKQMAVLQNKQKEEFSRKRALDIFRLDQFVRKVLLSRREQIEQELQQALVQLNQEEDKALRTLNPPTLPLR